MMVGLGVGSATAIAASPEDEIARLNRVRANLFEELIKTRAEAAAARAELDAAVKARDQAEAELARLKQEAASGQPPRPASASQTTAEPQKRAQDASSTKPQGRSMAKTGRPTDRQNVAGSQPVTTASVPRVATAASRADSIRASVPGRIASRKVKPTPPKPVNSAARAQELPSVLRLQGPQ
jgi:hypothetical protein